MSDNLSTRKRTTSASSSVSPSTTAANLPPSRKSQPLRTVSPPLSNTRLSRLIYLLIILTTVLGAFYSYRVVQYKSEVGGWWNLALGRKPPHMDPHGEGKYFGKKHAEHKGAVGDSVEDRINALAEALGMPSKELASAIAVAVKQYVPPASLSSVMAKETGTAVEALMSGASDEFVSKASDAVSTAAEAGATGVVGGVVSGMESFVGMDEP